MPESRATPELDYLKLVKEAKTVDAARCATRLRLALLADSATQHLAGPLKALFFREGVAAEVYEGAYDAIAQEALDPRSGLYAFKPDVVVILNDPRALRQRYPAGADARAFAEKAYADAAAVWDAVAAHSAATIIQGNYALPYERPFGHFDLKAADSFLHAVRELNARLAQGLRERQSVLPLDIEHLSGTLGTTRWFDQKLWHMGKAFSSFDCLPEVALAIVRAVKPTLGRLAKCVVVDLDNTLWGGVIGDDGLEGIRIGHLDDGEAFLELQRFLLELKKRGIILAVCSRNEEAAARLPFQRHPEMALKESDFAVFIANWTSKAHNLKTIQETLNIGLDSIVFLDDDPFERNLIRSELPGVVVPELPEDPADYVKTLSALGLFEAASYSREDKERSRMYADQAAREKLKAAFKTPEEYLRSLNMKIRLARFDAFHLPRIVQLISRSNQFNLTTKRYNEAECERLMKDEAGCFPFYVTLKDDLGDSGLIAVAVLRYEGKTLEIDEWLMSCRVLMRGVEEHMMNAVFALARREGFARVVGRYVPTPKNAMVKDFFARFRFSKDSEGADGSAVWSLDVERYEPKPVFFAET